MLRAFYFCRMGKDKIEAKGHGFNVIRIQLILTTQTLKIRTKNKCGYASREIGATQKIVEGK